MQIFKDDRGQAWELAINVTSLRRLKSLLPDCDLLALGPERAIALAADPFTLCDVLFVLLKPQADALGVSDVEFGERMGQSLGEAIESFWKDLTDFFQKLGRHDQARLMTIPREMLREVTEHNAGAIATFETEVKALMLKKKSADGKPSIDSPESSESIPDPLPSASSNGCPTENDSTNGTAAA